MRGGERGCWGCGGCMLRKAGGWGMGIGMGMTGCIASSDKEFGLEEFDEGC